MIFLFSHLNLVDIKNVNVIDPLQVSNIVPNMYAYVSYETIHHICIFFHNGQISNNRFQFLEFLSLCYLKPCITLI